MSYKRLKLKLMVFLAGHIVAMVTFCATKLTATCSPMMGQFVDTIILASTDKRVVIMTHQTVSLGKYWQLFQTSQNVTVLYRFHFFLSFLTSNSVYTRFNTDSRERQHLTLLLNYGSVHFFKVNSWFT